MSGRVEKSPDLVSAFSKLEDAEIGKLKLKGQRIEISGNVVSIKEKGKLTGKILSGFKRATGKKISNQINDTFKHVSGLIESDKASLEEINTALNFWFIRLIDVFAYVDDTISA